MATSTMAQLITLVRDIVYLPAPVTGATDYLSDTNILRWLNDAFEDMVDAVFGIPAYLEFTITSAGVITVTKSTSSPVVTSGLITTTTEDHVWKNLPAVRSWGRFLNLTDAVAETENRRMDLIDEQDARYQDVINNAQDYILWYALNPDKGFLLIPTTWRVTNTIGIHYKQNFVRLASGETPSSFFRETDLDYPVYTAAQKVGVQVEDTRSMPGAGGLSLFEREAMNGWKKFMNAKKKRNTGPARSLDNPGGKELI